MRPLGIGEKRQGQTEDGRDEKQANQRAKVEKKKQGEKKMARLKKRGALIVYAIFFVPKLPSPNARKYPKP